MSFYTRDNYPGYFIVEHKTGKKGDRVVISDDYLQNYSAEDIKNTIMFIEHVGSIAYRSFTPFPTILPCPLDCTEIDVCGQHIRDIPHLAMKNIRKIRAIHTSINNISELRDYPHLTELDLSYGQLREVRGLNHLPALTILNLSNNKITGANLASLGNLAELNLSHNKIADLSELIGLNSLINLRKFDIGFNQLSDLADIGNMKNIEILNLSGNKITNIDAIAQLKSLKYLNVANNIIRDFPTMKQKNIVAIIICNNHMQ